MKLKILVLMVFIIYSFNRLFSQNLLVDNSLEEPGTYVPVSNPTTFLFEFRASNIDEDLNKISDDKVSDHLFGQQVARKMVFLDEKYTFEVPIVPGNPQTKTMIRKPVIYDAVLKIERYLKKSVKKREISAESASDKYNKVLNVAINILTVNTSDFEEAIIKSRDLQSLSNLFIDHVKLVF